MTQSATVLSPLSELRRLLLTVAEWIACQVSPERAVLVCDSDFARTQNAADRYPVPNAQTRHADD